MKTRLLKVEIGYEHDVVLSRQRARQVAALLGFSAQEQVRIATAVSEIARNAFRYAKRGKIEFFIETYPAAILRMILTDQGSGIANLETILAGKYISRTGMGLGILGAKKLMDNFQIETGSQGTAILMEKIIPNCENEFNTHFFTRFSEEITSQPSEEPFVELQQQNQELLAAFTELENRQNELARLNLELEEAKKQLFLQNELLEDRVEERTCDLKESLQQMERFCYSIAHDLKAPLRAINGLTMILREEQASAFNDAGRKCTDRIMQSATRMDLLIADLLEYGRLTHIDVPFSLINLGVEINKVLEYLRGEIVSKNAIIEVQKGLPNVLGNSVLLHQVLSNLIENGLKFVKTDVTPKLKIWAEKGTPTEENGVVQTTTRLWIDDNGIGIATDYNQRIFKLFERLHGENSDYPGTGVGLALVHKAVERMNGLVGMKSVAGHGSQFWIELPNS